MPGWVQEGVNDYLKRLPRDMKVEFVEIPLGNRSKSADPKKAIAQESNQILGAINKDERVIALEVKGRNWSTEDLAKNMSSWQMDGDNIALLVGGPDGLSDDCRQRANQQWSLSALTLPHPIVRVVFPLLRMSLALTCLSHWAVSPIEMLAVPRGKQSWKVFGGLGSKDLIHFNLIKLFGCCAFI